MGIRFLDKCTGQPIPLEFISYIIISMGDDDYSFDCDITICWITCYILEL